MTTTGAQTYGGAVTLSSDDDLTGTTVTFGSTVGGAHGLTVTGNGVFEGGVDIASLDVTGTADLNGGTVTTSGTQTYTGAVVLGTSANLAGGAIDFASRNGGTVGGQSLTLIGATITIGNNIGANTALNGVTLSGGNIFLSGNIMTANGAVYVPSGSIVLESNVSIDTTEWRTAGGASIYISRVPRSTTRPVHQGVTA